MKTHFAGQYAGRMFQPHAIRANGTATANTTEVDCKTCINRLVSYATAHSLPLIVRNF